MSFTPPPSLPPREEQATNRRVQILREGRPVSNIYDPDRNTSFSEQSDGSAEVSTSPLRRFLSEQPRHRSGGRGDNAGIEKVSLISRWMAEKRRESRDVGSLNKKKTSGFTPRKKVLEQQQQQRERRCVSYRWKIRIESILLLCILGIPGNTVTLILFANGPNFLDQPGNSFSNSSNSSSNNDINNSWLPGGQNNSTLVGTTEANSTKELSDNKSELSSESANVRAIIVCEGDCTSHGGGEGGLEGEDEGDEEEKYGEDPKNLQPSLKASNYSQNCHEPLPSIVSLLDGFNYWLEGVTLTTVAFFGLLGNLLTIVVLRNFDHKSAFNTLLIMLVSMDSVVLGFSLFDSYLNGFGYPEPLWYKVLFPKFWHPLKNVAISGCIYMVVAVAAERYHAICHPLKYKPNPALYFVLVVFLALLVNFPKFLEFKHFYKNGTLSYWTTELNENATYVIFNSYHECAIIGVLPLLALCYLNYKIYRKIRKSSELKQRHFGRSCGGGGSREPTNLSVNQPQSGDQDQPGRKPSLYSTGKRKYSNSSNVAVTATHANKGTHSHLSPILTKSNSSRQGSKRLLHNKPSLGGGAVTNLSVTKSLSVEDTPSCASSTQCPQGSVRLAHSSERRFQSRREKSTGILLCIILIFCSCHIFRLGIQIYEIASPSHGLVKHFNRCAELEQLHVPAIVLILGNINHLLLVTNSSVNFLIYCCMAKRFRKALFKLFNTIKKRLFCVQS